MGQGTSVALGSDRVFQSALQLQQTPPGPTISILQRSHLVTVLGLLWERWTLVPLSSPAQEREVVGETAGRSASCATPPLPQEPIGPNLAFALEEIEGWVGNGTPTFGLVT